MIILELGTLRSQTHEKDLLVTLLTEVPLLTKQCAHGFQTYNTVTKATLLLSWNLHA